MVDAWGAFLGRIAWEVFITLTFDPKQHPSVTRQFADYEALRWCGLLSYAARRPLEWAFVVERGTGGSLHVHVLMIGVPSTALLAGVDVWRARNGKIDVRRVYDVAGISLYSSKSVAGGGEVVLADTLHRHQRVLDSQTVVPLFASDDADTRANNIDQVADRESADEPAVSEVRSEEIEARRKHFEVQLTESHGAIPMFCFRAGVRIEAGVCASCGDALVGKNYGRCEPCLIAINLVLDARVSGQSRAVAPATLPTGTTTTTSSSATSGDIGGYSSDAEGFTNAPSDQRSGLSKSGSGEETNPVGNTEAKAALSDGERISEAPVVSQPGDRGVKALQSVCEHVCPGCHKPFKPRRRNQRHHNASCRWRACRERRALLNQATVRRID